MIRRWKNLKRWKKWMIGTGTFLFLIVLGTASYLYFKIKTVDLDAIIAKHQGEVTNEAFPSSSASPQSSHVPSLLEQPLEKANTLTDKSIKTEDALDVAAILMNSGLSLKEMSYLTGKSTEKLSTEEKQKIRDLLLEKLTPKEIEALRSITSQYGKFLVILDPNYPIELVGVYDEKERENIIKELEEKKKTASLTGSSNTEPAKEAHASPSPSPSPLATPTTKPAETSEQKAVKQKIDAKYDSQFAALQKSCQSEVADLTNKVKEYIKDAQASGKELTVMDLQSKFLSEIAAAESNCDQQFNSILSKAQAEYKAAGLGSAALDSYKTQYQQSKNKARSSALSQIIAVWKSGSSSQ